MESNYGTKQAALPAHRTLQWWAILYLRLALGISFLSGIADRFGLYTGRNVGYGNFEGFVRYTAKVNAFYAALDDSIFGVGCDNCGTCVWTCLGTWDLAEVGGSG